MSASRRSNTAGGHAPPAQPANRRLSRAASVPPQGVARTSSQEIPPDVSSVGMRETGGADLPASPVIIELPAPPSVNSLFKNLKGGGRGKTQGYVDWISQCGWRLKSQRPRCIAGRVLVLISCERFSERADVDNVIKPTLDLIVKHGVIEDDRFVDAVAASWTANISGMMRVLILPTQDVTLSYLSATHPGAPGGWVFSAPFGEPDEC